MRGVVKAYIAEKRRVCRGEDDAWSPIADGYDPGEPKENHDEILLIEWEGGPEVFEAHESTKGEGGYSWQMGYTTSALASRPGQWGSTIRGHEVKKVVEIRFDTSNWSKGYLFLRGGRPNYGYIGYYDSPISVWDVTDPDPGQKPSPFAQLVPIDIPGESLGIGHDQSHALLTHGLLQLPHDSGRCIPGEVHKDD